MKKDKMKKEKVKKDKMKKDKVQKGKMQKDKVQKDKVQKDKVQKGKVQKDKVQKGKMQKAKMQKGSVSDEEVAVILDVLRKRKEYVTTVESLTAGMISSRIADIPGSSDVLRRAFITYCDQAKHEMAGVKQKTLKKYTAVSRQVAKQMAKGGAEKAKADACISATGYAGPPSGPDDKTVGLVYLGCCYHGKTIVEEHHYTGPRNEIRAKAMTDGLRLLQRML